MSVSCKMSSSGYHTGISSVSSSNSVDSLNSDRLSFHTTSSSKSSIDSLNPGYLHLNSKYSKFERYLTQLITIARNVLFKHDTCEKDTHRFLSVDKYFKLRDRIQTWFARPGNGDLFQGTECYFYVAQMKIIMEGIERALALSHEDIAWPDPVFGVRSADAQMQDVYQQFDELVFGGRELEVQSLPWNRELLVC